MSRAEPPPADSSQRRSCRLATVSPAGREYSNSSREVPLPDTYRACAPAGPPPLSLPLPFALAANTSRGMPVNRTGSVNKTVMLMRTSLSYVRG